MNACKLIPPRNELEIYSYKSYIDLLSISDNPSLVGSAAYNIKYYSDLDIFDHSKVDLDKTDAIKYYSNLIQDKVYNIKLSKYSGHELYLTDFKIGIDSRFQVDLSEENADNIIIKWKSILSETEYENLLNYSNFNDLLENVRLLSILRWNIEEIIRGYKIHYSKNPPVIEP